ncbi:MAG: pectate lyase [Prevotella sp.]|nr:pectate lyase [Prevotella sp.]
MKKYLLTLAAAVLALTAAAQVPAFPGAEGHGRYTTGGRGGKIIHVTNLNDSGDGSFRQAVSGSDKKIVVFDVGGVIALKSDVSIGQNTTILGQTAPAPGITLRYYTVQFSGGNVIVRFLRSRRGQEKDVNDGADAIWTRNKTSLMLDHCSFSWSIDEVASFYDNNNFTMQWCTIGESLNNAGHGKGAHGYGGIWGGKLASFHHNLICHVNNRSPRFNGARYDWSGYTSNKLYDEYRWQNTVQAENVDFRNCVIYNCGNGCYGGPGGGQINIVNNYYKTGPAGSTSRVTNISVGASGNASGYPIYWGMTSRYYINGNQMNNTANYDWTNVAHDDDVKTSGGELYSEDPNHYYGSNVEYKAIGGKDYVKIKLDNPGPAGEVTTHSAVNAYNKVLQYAGASLNSDDVDLRYFDEAKNGTATYSGSVTKKKGRIDLVSDVKGYTEKDFGTGSREAGFDTDGDGIPDAWETANGLNPADASDANAYTIDPMKYYTNIEVYANSLVQDIMLNGNGDAAEAAKEYYPKYVKADGTVVEAINTLGLVPGGDSQETALYTVMFNGDDVQSTDGFFSFGTADNKHSFNGKFSGSYDGLTYSSGLKMEGSTLIQFTTTATSTVTIVQSTWSEKTLKFDNETISLASATTPAGSEGVRVYTIYNVPAGEHKITRGDGESGVFRVEVKYDGTSGIAAAKAASADDAAEQYNLEGQRVDDSYKGIVIRNGKKFIRK